MLELVENSNSKCMNMEKLWRDWKNITVLDPREKNQLLYWFSLSH